MTPPLVVVVCDSPKHARGKVAKLATFIVAEDGRAPAGAIPGRWLIEFDNNLVYPEVGNARGHRMNRDALPCKLCGRSLPTRDPRVGAALRRFAEAGVATVSLTELAANIISQG